MDLLIQQYLSDNSITAKNGVDYTLVDHQDGSGIQIGVWLLPIARPSFSIVQIEDAEKKAEVISAKSVRITTRLNYLRETDWYTNREMDEPNSYPIEIKNKRILARQEINLINSYQTLGELSQIEVNFS